MRKVAVVFPGQGSQLIGMGREFYEKYSYVQELYKEAENVLGKDVKEMIFNGSEEELKKTSNAQIAVYLTSMAAYTVFLKETGIKPYIAAGHSLGEISAITAAGMISFKDGIDLIKDRATYMEEAFSSETAMYAIRSIHYKTVEKLIRDFDKKGKIAVISNYNSIDQLVISGEREIVNKLVEFLNEKGANITELKVSGAFHSPFMSSAAEKFKARLMKENFNAPKFPVLANIDAKLYDKERIIEILSEQIQSPVRWLDIILKMESLGVDSTVEIGTGRVLSRLIESTSDIKTYKFGMLKDVDLFCSDAEWLIQQNKRGVVDACIAAAVTTPNLCQNENEYEKGVLEPVKKLKAIKNELEKGHEKADESKIKESEKLLDLILKTKNIPDYEKSYIMQEIRNLDEYRLLCC